MRKIALMVLMIAATTAVGRTCPTRACTNNNGMAGVSIALQQALQESIHADISCESYDVLSSSEVDDSAEEIVIDYEDIDIYNANYTGWKTWMDYRAITKKSSRQYILQQECYTGESGVRMYDDRYCIAVGTGVGACVGQYVDLILENGAEIPCIVSDIKASNHTTSDNIFTNVGSHLCCSEFVVEKESINGLVRRSGDASNVCSIWDSPVIKIRVYTENYFNKEE